MHKNIIKYTKWEKGKEKISFSLNIHFILKCAFSIIFNNYNSVILFCKEKRECLSSFSNNIPILLGKSKEAEIKRINKELANIRSKFKGDKTLDGYQKKKYVCKLLFIFLLGHDIDFGHMEAVNLLSSNKYSEKQIVSIIVCVIGGADTI